MNIIAKEIMSKVNAFDCEAVYCEDSGISVSYDGVEIAKINGGKIKEMDDLNDDEYYRYLLIQRLFENIKRYCSAYEKGKIANNPALSDDYRVLFRVGNTKLAARYDNDRFEFAVWGGNSKECEVFSGYNRARERFAVRSGLIDGEKLFSDAELKLLNYCVFEMSTVIYEENDFKHNKSVRDIMDLERKVDLASGMSVGDEV